MSQQTSYFPLGGGMDLTTPAVAIPPGRVIAALNYEPVASGYRRLSGYERFDGRTAPSSSAVPATIATLRAAITAVPGSGPVRGVWAVGGKVFAVRDNSGATAGVPHVATSGGWTALPNTKTVSFTSGGTYMPEPGVRVDLLSGATSGAGGEIIGVNLTSGSWAGGDAAGSFILTNASGTFSAAENLDILRFDVNGNFIGVVSNNATYSSTSSTVTLPAGGRYEFITHNFYGASNLSRAYAVNGVGKALMFEPVAAAFTEISTGMAIDKPTHLAAHKGSLFLSFNGGSVQFSMVGDPLSFDAVIGAGEIGVGSDITGFIEANGALAIFCEGSISVLYGNDATDYQLERLNEESGALAHTMQNIGQVVYMDNRGLRSLAASQRYGNFSMGTLSRLIQPLLEDKRRDGVEPAASLVCRTADQYWLFFDDGTGIIVNFSAKDPTILPFNLGITITCSASIEDDGQERIFLGASNGFVYELNKGTSFDGSAIEHYLRLPFNHFGKPQQKKVVKKVLIDAEASGTTTLGITAEFDYGSVPGSSTIAAIITTGGAAIDGLGSNELYYASQIESQAEVYLDGLCQNISLKIGGSTSTENPHTLTGVTYHLLLRGLET